MTILEMSAQAALIIAVVTFLRAIAINRLPKTAFSALWAVALCRLVIPFELPSTLSVYNVLGVSGSSVQAGQTVIAPFTTNTVQGGSANGNIGTGHALLIVWLAGMAGAFVFLAASYIKNCREFRVSLPAQNAFVAGWMERHKLRRHVTVRVSDRITVPLTYGVLKPRIMLPKTIDWEARKAAFFEKVPDVVLKEVIDCLIPVLEDD